MPAVPSRPFPLEAARGLWSASVTPENEKRAEGFGGGIALDGGRLYATTGYGTVVALNPNSGEIIWTQAHGRADQKLANGGRREDLFRLDR